MIRTRIVPMVVLALSTFSASAFAQTKAEPAKPATPAKPAAGAPAKPAEPAKPPADMKQAPAPMPTPEQMAEMMKPAAELANLNFFTTTWKCDSKMQNPGDPTKQIVTKSTMKGKWDLDKHWVNGSYEVKKTKEWPAMKAIALIGWDSAQKKYFFGGVDNWGGMMALWSDGGKDGTWTFEGNTSGMGMQAKMRMTFTVAADGKSLTSKYEMQMGKDWMTMGEDTCKK